MAKSAQKTATSNPTVAQIAIRYFIAVTPRSAVVRLFFGCKKCNRGYKVIQNTPVNQVIGWFPDHCLPDNDLGNLCVIMAVGRQSCLHRESAASSKDAYMMTISLLGVAAALLLCAILAKAFAHEPKASKSQKAEIVARLLALSETEQKLSKPASSVRLKAPIPIQAAGRKFAPATKSEGGERAKTPVPTLDVRFPKQQSPQRRTNLAGSSS